MKQLDRGKIYSFEEILSIKGYLVYTNVGNSMMPLLRQRRDIIEIHRLYTRAKKYDVVLYKQEDMYILHRVIKVRPNDYVICGDHNIWPEYGITDAQILGIMTRVIRNGKSITTDNFWYKLYVNLWCRPYRFRILVLRILARMKRLVRKL